MNDTRHEAEARMLRQVMRHIPERDRPLLGSVADALVLAIFEASTALAQDKDGFFASLRNDLLKQGPPPKEDPCERREQLVAELRHHAKTIRAEGSQLYDASGTTVAAHKLWDLADGLDAFLNNLVPTSQAKGS